MLEVAVIEDPAAAEVSLDPIRARLLAELAEPLGFDSIWSVEHHFTDYTMCPDVLQFLAYMAGKTTRAKLGSMGEPVAVEVEGKKVWTCCDGCPPKVKANPKKLYSWGHDVQKLAAAARIDLSDPEIEVVDNLTSFIEWAGRYPTAMTPEAHGEGASWSSDQVQTVRGLTDRLRTTLRDDCGLKP